MIGGRQITLRPGNSRSQDFFTRAFVLLIWNL
jgi:hypothetical protein